MRGLGGIVVLVRGGIVVLVQGGIVVLVEGGIVVLVEGGIVVLVEGGIVVLVEGGIVVLVQGGIVVLVRFLTLLRPPPAIFIHSLRSTLFVCILAFLLHLNHKLFSPRKSDLESLQEPLNDRNDRETINDQTIVRGGTVVTAFGRRGTVRDLRVAADGGLGFS